MSKDPRREGSNHSISPFMVCGRFEAAAVAIISYRRARSVAFSLLSNLIEPLRLDAASMIAQQRFQPLNVDNRARFLIQAAGKEVYSMTSC